MPIDKSSTLSLTTHSFVLVCVFVLKVHDFEKQFLMCLILSCVLVIPYTKSKFPKIKIVYKNLHKLFQIICLGNWDFGIKRMKH